MQQLKFRGVLKEFLTFASSKKVAKPQTLVTISGENTLPLTKQNDREL